MKSEGVSGMAITTEISKPLDNGFVQIDAAEKNGYKRYYKVPRGNAKFFADELKKQDKNLNIFSNVTFFTGIFAGVLGATYFTKKMESKMKQFLIQTASAITAAALSNLGFNEYADAEKEQLLKKHGAKEIFYRA